MRRIVDLVSLKRLDLLLDGGRGRGTSPSCQTPSGNCNHFSCHLLSIPTSSKSIVICV